MKVIDNRENVKQYLQFLTDANNPLYKHEFNDVREELDKIESKLTLKDIANIRLLSDKGLCETYRLEPREINPKYVGYVLDKEDEVTEEKRGSVIFITRHKVMDDRLKTDFVQMRENLIEQIGE